MMAFSVLLFPAPLAPTNATISPAPTEKDDEHDLLLAHSEALHHRILI
jgi:hypothetical protein